MRKFLTVTALFLFASPALADEDAAVEQPEAQGEAEAPPEVSAEKALTADPIYGEVLRQAVGAAREKVLQKLEEKTLAKQEQKMERVGSGAGH